MLTQEELLEEANRIIKEFQKYTKDFQVRDTLSDALLPKSVPGSLVQDCRFVLSRNLWKMCSIFGCNNGK